MKKEDVQIMLLTMIMILLLVLTIYTITPKNNYCSALYGGCGCQSNNINYDPGNTSDYTEEATITTVTKSGDYGTILVQLEKAPASIRITENTKITGITDRIYSFEALKVGLKLKITFDGPLAESYPLQGTAKTIHILSD